MKREECEARIKDLMIQINEVLSEYTGTKDNYLVAFISENHAVDFWNEYWEKNKYNPINHYSKFSPKCPCIKEQEGEVCPNFEPKEGDADEQDNREA